jgi:hypothetical protein
VTSTQVLADDEVGDLIIIDKDFPVVAFDSGLGTGFLSIAAVQALFDPVNHSVGNGVVGIAA